MPSLCRNVKTEYEALKTLNQEFVSACEKAGDPRALSADQLRTLQIQKQKLEKSRDVLKEKILVDPERAKEIMGDEQYFALEAIRTEFGIDLDPSTLPRVPFTERELREAKDRHDLLIYRPDRAADGTRLTFQELVRLRNATAEPVFGRKIHALAATAEKWCSVDPFYTEETPRSGWALVHQRGEHEPKRSTDILSHLQTIISHLRERGDRIRDGAPRQISAQYRGPYLEYQKYLDRFVDMTAEQIREEFNGSHWRQNALDISNLRFMKMAVPTAVEVFFDKILVRPVVRFDRALTDRTWSSSQTLDGDFVCLETDALVMRRGEVSMWKQPPFKEATEMGFIISYKKHIR